MASEQSASYYKQKIGNTDSNKSVVFAKDDINEKNHLDKLDDRFKKTLDTWLKFGSVFLTYRVGTYYFIGHDDSDTVLFDAKSLKLVVMILIGFAIYYLLVHPYIPVNIQHPILRNIANDTLLYGTVLVSSHLMETALCQEACFDEDWMKTAVLILLAFASYRIFIDPFVPLNNFSPTVKPIINDWAQFGTFLVAFRLLRGKSILDQNWILSVLFTLLGFTGYHLIRDKM